MNRKRFIEMSEREAAAYLAAFSENTDLAISEFRDRVLQFGVEVRPERGLRGLETAWLGVRNRFKRRNGESSVSVPDWCHRTTKSRIQTWSDETLWLFDGLVNLANATLQVEEPRCRWGLETYPSSILLHYPCLYFDVSQSDERQYVAMEHVAARSSRYVAGVAGSESPDYLVQAIFSEVLATPNPNSS